MATQTAGPKETKTMPPESINLTAGLSGGSRRVRFAAEPLVCDTCDQGSWAEISRRSPRSADPGWNNWNSRAPPPVWMAPAGGGYGAKPKGFAPRHCW